MKQNILFLCTGNSCRSILAEALLNDLGKQHYTAYSAGSFPTGQVNPDSISVLEDNGFSTFGLSSKSWNDLSHVAFDIVITVCDNAAGETCPMYLGQAVKAHWGISDPDKITGNKRRNAFDKSFIQMKLRIEKLLKLNHITENELNKIGKNT